MCGLRPRIEHCFLSKNAFFSKKICSCAFFVVPLHAFSRVCEEEINNNY